MKISTSYKVAFASLLGLAATIFPWQAKANLHNTYAQSVAQYGSKGLVDKANKCIYWDLKDFRVVEYYAKNECVAMILSPKNGLAYTVNDVQRQLPYNCGTTQVWRPVTITPEFASKYAAARETTDGLILASLYPDKSVQFGYTWFIKARGHLEQNGTLPSDTAPPIEDNNPTPDTQV
jgi:hypothetical protein